MCNVNVCSYLIQVYLLGFHAFIMVIKIILNVHNIANHYGTCLYQMFIPQCSNIASNSCGQPAALLIEGNMRVVI